MSSPSSHTERLPSVTFEQAVMLLEIRLGDQLAEFLVLAPGGERQVFHADGRFVLGSQARRGQGDIANVYPSQFELASQKCQLLIVCNRSVGWPISPPYLHTIT